MRTYWLSFASDKGFLGATVVDVTEEDRADAEVKVRALFPHNPDPAEDAWIAAASAVAHRLGCNPGGEMMPADITGAPEAARYTRGVLMSKDDIARIDGEEPVRMGGGE